MPTVYNGGQSPLEQCAITVRDQAFASNFAKFMYNCDCQYGLTHTRALADTLTPDYGRGTGGDLDINNYKAGNDWDINGNPVNGNFGGRNKAFAYNLATFGYDCQHCYTAPDTSKNKGQVIIT
jgi:predicted neuraminidase